MAVIAENTLSLISSRGVPMPRSQIQARPLPIKGSSTADSNKALSQEVFPFHDVRIQKTVISYHTSWTILYKDCSNGRIVYVNRRGTVRFCRGNFKGFILVCYETSFNSVASILCINDMTDTGSRRIFVNVSEIILVKLHTDEIKCKYLKPNVVQ